MKIGRRSHLFTTEKRDYAYFNDIDTEEISFNYN